MKSKKSLLDWRKVCGAWEVYTVVERPFRRQHLRSRPPGSVGDSWADYCPPKDRHRRRTRRLRPLADVGAAVRPPKDRHRRRNYFWHHPVGHCGDLQSIAVQSEHNIFFPSVFPPY